MTVLLSMLRKTRLSLTSAIRQMVLLQVMNIHLHQDIDLNNSCYLLVMQMQAKVLKVNDGEGQVFLTYRRLVADNGKQEA